jgi:ubiquinone/menaquinone biosynthesis C-methylase UbiE
MHFLDPKHALLQMALKDGMHVADLGAGSGHYARIAAHAVGKGGKVHAIDIQSDVLRRLQREALDLGLYNLHTIWGDIEVHEGTELGHNSMDAAILSNTLFQLRDKEQAIEEIKRIVRPGGRVLVIDWTDSHGGLGPHPDFVITEENTRSLFNDAGFSILKSYEGGPHHYSLVFETPES